MATREDVIELAARISVIRKEVSRLQDLQRELRNLERKLDEILGVVSTEEADNHSINHRIVTLLNSHSDRAFEAEEVQVELGIDNLNSVRSALARLTAEGKTFRQGRGKYSALAAKEELAMLKVS